MRTSQIQKLAMKVIEKIIKYQNTKFTSLISEKRRIIEMRLLGIPNNITDSLIPHLIERNEQR